ncbi:MAG TPA: M42 family metallopeptidase [Firmicutes bacterium]|nr:M42 family metallopeptidase [Bacillota bacterium]
MDRRKAQTMLEKIAGLLESMTAIPAPAGAEDLMIDYMRKAFIEAGVSASVDILGNVVACVRKARPGWPTVMVIAHMDQVGFVVRKIESSGYLRLSRLGGIPEKSLACQRIIILGEKGPVPGLIAAKAHHATRPEEKYRVLPIDEVFVDVCASSAREVNEMGVAVGNFAVYEPHFYRRGDIVQATSLDNRAGCAALLVLAEELAKRNFGVGLYLVGSVQEEFNLRGILPAARAIQPTLGISIDVSVASDTPDLGYFGDLRLGGGPAINLFSFHGRGELNGVLPNPKLKSYILSIAESRKIPVQRNTFFGGLTDASYVQLEGPGIPCIELGIPLRYTHAPIEACAISDIKSCIELLISAVMDLPDRPDLSRGVN